MNRFDAILEEAARLRAHRRNETLIVSKMIKAETRRQDNILWREVDKEFKESEDTRKANGDRRYVGRDE